MNNSDFYNQRGFIALISIIIISAILGLLTFVLSTGGFFLRFNVLDSEFKKISVNLADACVSQAMLELAQGTVPVLPQTVPVGTNSCKLCYISDTAQAVNPKTIKTRAVYQGSYSNITAVVTQDPYGNFIVNSWDENPSYTGSCNVP